MITRKEKARKLLKSVWHFVALRSDEPLPVFIFGEMRSGTNMLTDCLDKSWQTAIYNESDDDAFRGYALLEDQKISELIRGSNATHVVFKSLADSARAQELLDVFPHAKAIWIFRNYDDVVNSAMKKWTEHNKYLSYILHEPGKAGWRATNLPDSLRGVIKQHFERGVSDESARALIWYVRNRLFFEQSLDQKDNVLLIRYEDAVRHPQGEFARIFDFLGLPLKDTYFEKVSTRSIRRDTRPALDESIAALCAALHSELVQLTRTVPAG